MQQRKPRRGGGRGNRTTEGDPQWRGTSRPIPTGRNNWRGSTVRARRMRAHRLRGQGIARPQRPRATGADPAAAGDRQGARAVGDPPRPAARRTRLRPGEAGAAQRDPRPVRMCTDRLRIPGTRFRQQRDPRPLRHARAQRALPGAAARQPHRVLLLDDRAAGRCRPEGVHHHGGARRRPLGDQRREVVLVVRVDGVVHHRHGDDRPGCAAVPTLFDVRRAR